jgi:uncharacterized membrane protein
MATVRGERTVEIEAPIARCYAIAADIERAPDWQAALVSASVVERDGSGRPALVDTDFDAKVRRIGSRMRFSYAPESEVTWRQERGDVKAMHGSWRFEDLGGERTRATYSLEVDPGRILGLLLRGPTEAKVRDFLLGDAADGLKRQAEAG